MDLQVLCILQEEATRSWSRCCNINYFDKLDFFLFFFCRSKYGSFYIVESENSVQYIQISTRRQRNRKEIKA